MSPGGLAGPGDTVVAPGVRAESAIHGGGGVPVFRPTRQANLTPSRELARLAANMDALRTLRLVQEEARPATAGEQRYLARWGGWGALSAVFDTDPADPDRWAARYGHARAELDRLFTPGELAAAARTTINAHYTDVVYAAAVWEAVTGLGFTGGRVLEPGCGAGVFLGLAPTGTDLVGIEWDPTTAAIAALLYPNATVLPESFADTRATEGSFDAVVGNVPFGDVVLADPRHNPARLSIHNHFIVKALHLTRPGGLVAVLTSRYTMDAVNPAARREMAALADLVGAVRLPAGAHRRAAGTDAVTDLLILRRRDPDTPPAGTGWEQTRRIEVDGVAVAVNEYFHTHPQHVLGRFALGGAYRGDELTVDGDPDAEAGLREALAAIVAQATVDGLVMTDRPAGYQPRPVAYAHRHRQPDGYLHAMPDGTFTRISGGTAVPHVPPATQADELRTLLALRDVEVALLAAEAASIDDTEQMDQLRDGSTRSTTTTSPGSVRSTGTGSAAPAGSTPTPAPRSWRGCIPARAGSATTRTAPPSKAWRTWTRSGAPPARPTSSANASSPPATPGWVRTPRPRLRSAWTPTAGPT